MKAGKIPLSLRFRKALKARTSLAMRNAAVRLADASDWCMSRTKASSRESGSASVKRMKAQIGWRSLLTQLGTHNAMAAILDYGLLGNDMPRDTRLPRGNRILVLAAHQDDETIGAAGTFLLCARAGNTFRMVYYTDGATAFADLDHRTTSRLRQDEARQVWKKIAGAEPVLWNYPNCAETIADDSGERFAALIREFRPTSIFVPVFLEQPLEHRRMTEVLIEADAIARIPASTEIWGYQITTRAPGNVVIDITGVWRKKYAVNRLWVTQNTYMDYAHLAMGRDIASSYYLKAKRVRRTAGHAEMFFVFDAPDYIAMAKEFLDVPGAAAMGASGAAAAPPPNFFIVGMQKSGSYWLTALLDLHPQIRCFPSRPGHADGSGEAHLFDLLARMETDYSSFKKSMDRKLDGHFASILPKRQPADDQERAELRQAIREKFNEYCQLQRLRYGKPVVGEKTTETVHHLDLVERLYPGTLKVCLLRDPRDRAVSFFFHQKRKGRLPENAEISAAHVENYIARVKKDYEGLLQASEPVHVLTYEQLSTDIEATLAALLRAIGVDDSPAIIERMTSGAGFQSLAKRAAGDEDAGSHFRKGVVGDWRNALPPDLADRMVEELGTLTAAIESKFGLDLSAYGPAALPTGQAKAAGRRA